MLVLVWTIMFIGTHVPRVPRRLEVSSSDKVLHFAGYAAIAFWLTAFRARRSPLDRKLIARVCVLLAAYGIADELLQIPVGRDADVWDWVADCLGSLAGACIFAGLAQWWGKRAA